MESQYTMSTSGADFVRVDLTGEPIEREMYLILSMEQMWDIWACE